MREGQIHIHLFSSILHISIYIHREREREIHPITPVLYILSLGAKVIIQMLCGCCNAVA